MGNEDSGRVAETASPNDRAESEVQAENGIKERVFDVVSERTGYPKEMLDLDLDLEADLGIDETKQGEILRSICGFYNIPLREKPAQRHPTLAHVIEFVCRERSKLVGSAPYRTVESQPGREVSEAVSVLDQPVLNDIGDVVAAAKQVFGADAGLRWLGTPVPALKYATPISLADTPAGRQKIHDALMNLAHGNW